MQTINNILQQLATTSATTAKLNILKSNVDNETLKQIFVFAYNPTYNYYIKKIPQYTTVNDQPFIIAFDCLNKLINREVTGNAAIELLAITLSNLSSENAVILENIIKGDMRCGISATTVNKVWKDLIPDFPYMRCSLPKKAKVKLWPFKKGVYQQLKADGQFINLNYDINGEVSILSRQGSEYPLVHFTTLVNDVKQSFTRDTQSHGEVIVFRNGVMLPREISNGLMNSVQKGGTFDEGDVPRYFVWDQIPLSAVVTNGKYHVPYSERYNSLVAQCNNLSSIEVIETNLVYSIDEVIEQFKQHLESGLEGSIIKHPDAIWEDTTSNNQVKLKLNADVDLKIVGFNPGNGKNAKTFGSIKCVSADTLLEVNISGFTDAKRLEIQQLRDQLIDTIITIKGNCIMPPTKSNDKYSVFLPRFVELRSDKTTADDLERIQDSFADAINEIRKQFE